MLPSRAQEDKIFRAVPSPFLLDKFSSVEEDRTEGRAHLTRRLLWQDRFVIVSAYLHFSVTFDLYSILFVLFNLKEGGLRNESNNLYIYGVCFSYPPPLLGRWQRKCKTLNRYPLPNTTQVGSTKMIIHVSQKILYNEMKQEIMTNEISMLKRK